MRGAGREIGMVQVIGLDPAFDEGPHQRLQRLGVVIDPRSSTDWLTIGMPASMMRAQAARAAAVNSRG